MSEIPVNERLLKPVARYQVETRLDRTGSYILKNIETNGPLQFKTSRETAERLCTDPSLAAVLCEGGIGFPTKVTAAAKTQDPDGNTIYYLKPQFSGRVLFLWGAGSKKSTAAEKYKDFTPHPFYKDRDGFETFLRSIAEKNFGIYGHKVIIRPLLNAADQTAQFDLEDIIRRLNGQVDLPNVQKRRLLRPSETRTLNAEDIAKELKTLPFVVSHKVSLGHIKDHPEILVSLSLQPNTQLFSESNPLLSLKVKGTNIEAFSERGTQITTTAINEEGKKIEITPNAVLATVELVLSLSHKDQQPCFDPNVSVLIKGFQSKIVELFRN